MKRVIFIHFLLIYYFYYFKQKKKNLRKKFVFTTEVKTFQNELFNKYFFLCFKICLYIKITDVRRLIY